MNQSENKYEALPHFALMNRVHLRVLRAVEFHREFWQVRKWSYHSVSRRTVRILLDLESHCFGRYSGAPNLRTFLTLINATCGIIIVQFAFFTRVSILPSMSIFIYLTPRAIILLDNLCKIQEEQLTMRQIETG